ncbi:MAG TPA: DinB family protein [Verrucomicrobiae bacterium]|jgi:uncharacterized damage-inducible protein DinB|nr:DinB family protein [Verrucomicrobiae bacterium]
MSEVDRILKHYDDVLSGDPWHGEPVWTVLSNISFTTAAARPVGSAHSIWEIVAHMIFWEGVVIKRLAGERAGLVEELNFAVPTNLTQENWEKTLEQFRASNQLFRQALKRLAPGQLDQLTAARKRTFYEEAHGLIEHHVYHLGQISLLKRAAQ